MMSNNPLPLPSIPLELIPHNLAVLDRELLLTSNIRLAQGLYHLYLRGLEQIL